MSDDHLLGEVIGVLGERIRLTAERWSHIKTEHPEIRVAPRRLLETLDQPDLLCEPRSGARAAVAQLAPGRWLIVVYIVDTPDPFVVTSYETTRRTFENWRRLWP